MKKMFIFIIIIFLILGLLLAKNAILKLTLEKAVRAISGLRLSIGAIDVGLIKPLLKVQRLTLLNPDKFPDRIMFEIPLLYIRYDIGSLFKNKIHLEDMTLELKEVSVVRNADGELNLNSLNIVKGPPKKKEKKVTPKQAMPAIMIDRLHLKVGKVIYKDYTQAPFPRILEFNINLDEKCENIRNPYALGSLIVTRSLYKTSISQLTGFDLGTLEGTLEGIVSKGSAALAGTLGETKEALKEIIKLPFGRGAKDE
ncbi:MAG: hypothetical protein HZA30_04005 [Candidatus Omnitrophica bacterium]|nr:hypothetical protein [Candidatus Omnitrophota bacterium]